MPRPQAECPIRTHTERPSEQGHISMAPLVAQHECTLWPDVHASSFHPRARLQQQAATRQPPLGAGPHIPMLSVLNSRRPPAPAAHQPRLSSKTQAQLPLWGSSKVVVPISGRAEKCLESLFRKPMCGAGLTKGGTKGTWGCLYRDCYGAFVGVNFTACKLKKTNKQRNHTWAPPSSHLVLGREGRDRATGRTGTGCSEPHASELTWGTFSKRHLC